MYICKLFISSSYVMYKINKLILSNVSGILTVNLLDHIIYLIDNYIELFEWLSDLILAITSYIYRIVVPFIISILFNSDYLLNFILQRCRFDEIIEDIVVSPDQLDEMSVKARQLFEKSYTTDISYSKIISHISG